MAKHIECTHVFICEICKEWDCETEYRGDKELARHKELVHVNCDRTLSDEEFANLKNEHSDEIECCPDTPRRNYILKRRGFIKFYMIQPNLDPF